MSLLFSDLKVKSIDIIKRTPVHYCVGKKLIWSTFLVQEQQENENLFNYKWPYCVCCFFIKFCFSFSFFFRIHQCNIKSRLGFNEVIQIKWRKSVGKADVYRLSMKIKQSFCVRDFFSTLTPSWEMSRTVVVFICFLLVSESLVICIGNTFKSFVFWSQRFSMKRSCYLLLNLAIADLLVGVEHPIPLITKKKLPVLLAMKTPTFENIIRFTSNDSHILVLNCCYIISQYL